MPTITEPKPSGGTTIRLNFAMPSSAVASVPLINYSDQESPYSEVLSDHEEDGEDEFDESPEAEFNGQEESEE